MGASVTKPGKLCKTIIAAVCLLLTAAAGSGEKPEKPRQDQDLRDCIAAARGAEAIAACEKSRRAELEMLIKRWTAGIRKRLDGKQRAQFDRNVSAWEAFRDSEVKMLDLTLEQRRDGLGSSLKPGAVTRIYEQRERQLREHLHNLSYAGQAPQ